MNNNNPNPTSPPPLSSPSSPPDRSKTFTCVRTTLPRPPPFPRNPILTDRLVLRPPTERDIPALHVLRTQPEVMRWTSQGRPDGGVEETRAAVWQFLVDEQGGRRLAGEEEGEGARETFNFLICLRREEDNQVGEGEVIGIGGCLRWKGAFGWPEVGYMIRREVWGKGLATEFLRGWMEAWEGLEREEVEIEVDRRTVEGQEAEGEGEGEGQRDGLVRVREQLVAITAQGNEKSQKVLGKCGFEWFTTWTVEEEGEEGKVVALPTFRR
ncbi:hypothetical protein VTJ04DRAFT_1660 [Mycothermus thermophilus]|uniref:uncharacterized protein n=1 Tax=Humicola insolens TaxID=85995 RepID=UPI0037437F88